MRRRIAPGLRAVAERHVAAVRHGVHDDDVFARLERDEVKAIVVIADGNRGRHRHLRDAGTGLDVYRNGGIGHAVRGLELVTPTGRQHGLEVIGVVLAKRRAHHRGVATVRNRERFRILLDALRQERAFTIVESQFGGIRAHDPEVVDRVLVHRTPARLRQDVICHIADSFRPESSHRRHPVIIELDADEIGVNARIGRPNRIGLALLERRSKPIFIGI